MLVFLEIKYAKDYIDNCEIINSCNADDMINTYLNCTFTMTGRIHGAVPALRGGKEVAYYSAVPDDSRESLLEDIGLNKYTIDKYSYRVKCKADSNKIDILKKKMLKWKDIISEKVNSGI